MRVREWAVVAAVVAGTGLAGAGVAAAQPSEPVTITLSPEQVTKICEQRIPRITERITRLTERVTGDASTRGSSAWLKERAAKERAAGREAIAKGLDERADRRAARVPELAELQRRVADFSAKHCGGTK